MSDRLEQLIKGIYRRWKANQVKTDISHPDEEEFALFVEGRLISEKKEEVRSHLMTCERCLEALEIQLRLKGIKEEDVPMDILERAKRLLEKYTESNILEIILKLKEKTLQLLNTTGDVLVGQEFIPAPLLRSRSLQDFKDELTILKDFQEIRVEVKIEDRKNLNFNVIVVVREKNTQNLRKDLRVTLISKETELESYLADSGKVTFEQVSLGQYTIEIFSIADKLASIILDINK